MGWQVFRKIPRRPSLVLTAYLVVLVDSYKKLNKDETGTALFTKIKDTID